MPLPPIVLDDLSWEDLVRAARDRIPAASKGQWTLHAPVDPGITLLELFAAQLEERLYWLDQDCDSRARAILTLLGTRPRPATSAATVLAFFCHEKHQVLSPELLPIIHAGLVMQPEGAKNAGTYRSHRAPLDEGLPKFTVANATSLLPIAYRVESGEPRWDPGCVGLSVNERDVTLDLMHGRAPRLWPDANTGQATATIILWLRQAPPYMAKAPVSVLIDLDAPIGIETEWLSDADRAPPVAPVRWSYWDGSSFAALASVEDGTRGLRRSGIVRFPWPALGSMVKDAPVPVYRPNPNVFAFALRVTATTGAFPARIKQIAPNAVVAGHEVQVTPDVAELKEQLVEWNRIKTPNVTLHLPAADGTILPESVHLTLRENGTEHEWSAVEDLRFSGPADRHFVLDRAASTLRFGSGYRGRLPVSDQDSLTLRYNVGGGATGNLARHQAWTSMEQPPHWMAVNVVAAEGGREAESLAAARRRTATDWNRPTRCVTLPDCERLARETPSVAIARAKAVAGVHLTFPCLRVEGALTVFLVPGVPQPEPKEWLEHANAWAYLVPDSGVLQAVADHLERGRLLTQEIFVEPARYQSVRVSIWIGGIPAEMEVAREKIQLALHRFFHCLWGGVDQEGWPFGGSIFPFDVLHQVQSQMEEGMLAQRALIDLLDSEGCPTASTDCDPLPLPEHHLPLLCEVRVYFSSQPSMEGGLG